MSFSSLNHTRKSGDTLFAILSLSVLSSLDRQKIRSLNQIGIRTISDLLHYTPIQNANILMAISQRRIGHDTSVEFLLDNAYINRNPQEYPNLPVVAIEGIGEARARVLQNEFNVNTISDLANFQPFLEAQSFIAPDDEVFNEPASAPQELIPRITGSISSTAIYSDYVKKRRTRTDYELTHPGVDDSQGNNSANGDDDDASPKSPAKPDDLIARLFVTEKFEYHLGYITTYKQTWANAGTHLGEILYSLPLAPGESRNIAIIEWYRRQESSRDEDTGTSDFLSNKLVYARALSEVINATATEHLVGLTETDARTESLAKSKTFAATGNYSKADNAKLSLDEYGLPVDVSSTTNYGGNATGGRSRVYSENEQRGTLKTESSGQRELLSETMQNITDTTSQNSEQIRSLWSSVVVADTQSEFENASTRNVTNYNHSHALTIQYYEVIQKYLTELKVQHLTPVLWLPYRSLMFDIQFIRENWFVLNNAVEANLSSDTYKTYASAIESDVEIFDTSFDLGEDGNLDEIRLISFSMEINPEPVDIQGAGRAGIKRKEGWFPSSRVVLSIKDGRKFGVERSLRKDTFNNLSIAINDLNNFEYDIRTKSEKLINLNKATVKLKCHLILEMTFEDANNNIAVITHREELSDSPETDEKNRNVTAARFEFAGVWDNFSGDDLARTITEELIRKYGERSNAAEAERKVFSEIEFHFAQRRYFYTNYLIGQLERTQIIELVSELSLSYRGDNEARLSDFIDPTPIATTDNLIAFRLHRLDDEDMQNTANEVKASINKFWESLDNEDNRPDAINDIVYLPTSGIFAEAILGQSNASEYIDLRRFWNWQDSPIPHQAPQILPVPIGSRQTGIPDNLDPTDIDSNLDLLQGNGFPDPSTVAVLQALQNGNLFRDAAKAEQLAGVLKNLSSLAETTASSAAKLTGDAASKAIDGAVDIGKQVTDLAKTLNKSVTERGGEKNEEKKKSDPDEEEPEPVDDDDKPKQNSGGGSKVGHVLWLSREPGQQEMLLYNFPVGGQEQVLAPAHIRALHDISVQIQGVDDIELVEGRASETVTESNDSSRTNEALATERMELVWVELLMLAKVPDPQSNAAIQKSRAATDPIRKKRPAALASVPEGQGGEDPAERSVLVRLNRAIDPDIKSVPVPGIEDVSTRGHSLVIENVNGDDTSIQFQTGGFTLFSNNRRRKLVEGDENVGYKVESIDNREGVASFGGFAGSLINHLVINVGANGGKPGEPPKVSYDSKETKLWMIEMRNPRASGSSPYALLEDLISLLGALDKISATLPNVKLTLSVPQLGEVEVSDLNLNKTITMLAKEVVTWIGDSSLVGKTLKGLKQGRVQVDLRVYAKFEGVAEKKWPYLDFAFTGGSGLHYLREVDDAEKTEDLLAKFDYQTEKSYTLYAWHLNSSLRTASLHYNKSTVLKDLNIVIVFIADLLSVFREIGKLTLLGPSTSELLEDAKEWIDIISKIEEIKQWIDAAKNWLDGKEYLVFDPVAEPEKKIQQVDSAATFTSFRLDRGSITLPTKKE